MSMSNWNAAALIDAFLHGLAAYIKDALVAHDVPAFLDGIIELEFEWTCECRRGDTSGGRGRHHRRPVDGEMIAHL